MNLKFAQKSHIFFVRSRILFIGYGIFALCFFAFSKNIQAEKTIPPLEKGQIVAQFHHQGVATSQFYGNDEHLTSLSGNNESHRAIDETTQPSSFQIHKDDRNHEANKNHKTDTTAVPSLFGSAFLGALTIPYQLEFFPDLRLGIGGSCNNSLFCKHYQPKLLRTHLQMIFANNIDWEERADTAKEHHLPMFNLAVEPLEMTFAPRIQVAFGRLQLFRAPRNINELLNVQVTVATLRTNFASTEHRWVRGGCFFDFAGPGVKYVSHAKAEVEPFVGLMVAGIKQGCDYDFGPQTVAVNLGYVVRSELFVGQSGAGSGMQKGPFGAILSEHRFEGYFGLRISSPNALKRIGIQSFQLNGTFGAFYHMDRGCLVASTEVSAACGNSTSNIELRTGVLLGVDWDIGNVSVPRLSPIRSSLQFGL